MTTLPISIELSSIAIETISQTLTPQEIILKIKNVLAEKFDVMGDFIETTLNNQRQFDDSLVLNQYQLSYEKQNLEFEFLHFKPRNSWEVKGFRFV